MDDETVLFKLGVRQLAAWIPVTFEGVAQNDALRTL
jgi:hypothetical protein